MAGILLHEAIGHGLEGDFNRKGTSAFSNMMGKQVAAKGITVVDAEHTCSNPKRNPQLLPVYSQGRIERSRQKRTEGQLHI